MAPPVGAGKWELRFASAEAADGWEKLYANIPTAANACWHALSDAPLAIRRDGSSSVTSLQHASLAVGHYRSGSSRSPAAAAFGIARMKHVTGCG